MTAPASSPTTTMGRVGMRKKASSALALLGVCVALFGIYVFGCQVVAYLKDGFWTPAPASDLILGASSQQESGWLLGLALRGATPLTGLGRWLEQPQAWFGVHKLVAGALDALPIAMAMLLIATVLIMFADRLDNGGPHATASSSS